MSRLGKRRCAGCPGQPCPSKAWFTINGRQKRCEDCQKVFPRYRYAEQRKAAKKDPSRKWREETQEARGEKAQAREVVGEVANPKASSRFLDVFINSAT